MDVIEFCLHVVRSSLRRSTRHATVNACPFMDTCPLEVRTMIYKLCLPVGKALVLKSTPCEKEEIKARRLLKTPFPELLQVNSKIREEAAPIFYGTNSWRIIDIPKGLSLPKVFFKHVHEATVTFDRRIMSIKDIWATSDETFEDTTRAGDRLQAIHDQLKENLLDTWQEKCSTLRKLSLTDLEVDFEHCKCPIGCCRMVEDLFAELDGYVTLQDDRKMEMTGLVFEYEAELLHTGNFRCEACHDGPEEEAFDSGPCWRSVLPEEIL